MEQKLTQSIIDGDTAAIKAALMAGADPNKAAVGGDAAILYVAEHATEKQVRILLNAGADPNQGLEHKALAVAADAADVGKVEALLQAGASPNARDAGGKTALYRAVVSLQGDAAGRGKVARALLNAGADPDAPVRVNKNLQSPREFVAAVGGHTLRRIFEDYPKR